MIKKNVEIDRNLKKALQIRKELNHDNITRFIGACVETPHVYILTNYCARGSLKVILKSYLSSCKLTYYELQVSQFILWSVVHQLVVNFSHLVQNCNQIELKHEASWIFWKSNCFPFVPKVTAMVSIFSYQTAFSQNHMSRDLRFPTMWYFAF